MTNEESLLILYNTKLAFTQFSLVASYPHRKLAVIDMEGRGNAGPMTLGPI